jgi:hypothetical protein
MHRLLAALLFCFVAGDLSGAASARYFGGYRCINDCKEHAAGFRSAARRRVLTPKDCESNSPSFSEGCRVYLRDRMRDPSRDDNGGRI